MVARAEGRGFHRAYSREWIYSPVTPDGKLGWRSPGGARGPIRPAWRKYWKAETKAALDYRVGAAVLRLGDQGPSRARGLEDNGAEQRSSADENGKRPATEPVAHLIYGISLGNQVGQLSSAWPIGPPVIFPHPGQKRPAQRQSSLPFPACWVPAVLGMPLEHVVQELCRRMPCFLDCGPGQLQFSRQLLVFRA